MADKSPGTWTLVALVIAVFGVAAPIIWDQYKTRSALELQVLSRTTLVQRADALKKLEITYAGKPIPGISRLEFALLNSGKTPIKSQDLISPPTVKFSREFEILEVEAIDRSPKNLEVDVVVEPGTNSARLTFPLLNPSDYFRFALIVAGTEPEFSAAARVVGVRRLDVSYRIESLPRMRLPWSVYMVGVSSLLSVGLVVVAANDLLKDRRLRKALGKGALFPKQALTKADFKAFFEATFGYRVDSDLDHVRKQIAALPDDNQPIPDDIRAKLEASASTILGSGGGATIAAIIFSPVALIGLLYVLWYVI